MVTHRFLWQLIFAMSAAVCVAVLSVLLIAEAVQTTQGVLVSEATQALTTAEAELDQQYRYRAAGDSSWNLLPLSAKDVSLRALGLTVLRSYPGVEGGFYQNSTFLGYAFPTHYRGEAKTDFPAAERAEIETAVHKSLQTGMPQTAVIRESTDLVAVRALPDARFHIAVWTMKRLAGRNAPGAYEREILITGLVMAALISVLGALATGIGLYRGIRQIKSGLAKLETDFSHRIPQRKDELGEIARSINRMAEARRELESQLRREDRLRAVGQLAASVAHEIRNPLNSIRLAMQLLQARMRDGTARARDVELVTGEVDRMNELLTELLDLQRSRKPEMLRQAIAPVIEHCIAVLQPRAAAQSVHVRASVPASATAVFDKQHLTQVLMNLLLNAIDASTPGGGVEIHSGIEARWIELTVTNDGPALTEKEREHLFEAFYTTKDNGVGLGLAVSRELMRAQRGDVLYESRGGRTAFLIRIPTEQHAEAHRSNC